MRLVFIVADATHAAHIGGEVERQTATVDIPDESIPVIVREYLRIKSEENTSNGKWSYLSMSVAIDSAELAKGSKE